MQTIESLLQEAWGGWDDAATLSRVGQELQRRSRLPEARRLLERALELDPSDRDAWANLAYACYRSLDDEAGHAALRRGTAAIGSDALRATLATFLPEEEAAEIREALRDTKDPAARAVLFGQRFWRGEHDVALEGMRALFQERPDDGMVREQLLWTLLGARRRGLVEGLDLHEDGLPLVDERLQAAPDSMEGWWMKMQLLHAEEDWPGLLEATGKALEHAPDEETVMLFRARAFREAGDEERAETWFQRAIGAKPSFAGARVELGKLYEEQGRLERAEEVFREIGAANPDYAMGPMSLALFLGRQGRWEEAEAVFLETWPRIPSPFQAGFRQSPQAKEILARPAVRAVVEADAEEGA